MIATHRDYWMQVVAALDDKPRPLQQIVAMPTPSHARAAAGLKYGECHGLVSVSYAKNPKGRVGTLWALRSAEYAR